MKRNDVNKMNVKAIAAELRELYPAHDELSAVIKRFESKTDSPAKLVDDLKGLIASYEARSMELNKAKMAKVGKKKPVVAGR